MGRVLGVKNKPKDVKLSKIDTIRLNANFSFPKQLKGIRQLMGVTGVEMAERLELAPSNVHHYETQNATNNHHNPFRAIKNNLTEIGFAYAKALGATKIEIIL
jgi:transcriptional regulator with XRE-family HTH domain